MFVKTRLTKETKVKKLVLRYSCFPSKLIIIINIIFMFNVSVIGIFVCKVNDVK